jgi:hypothetical protein
MRKKFVSGMLAAIATIGVGSAVGAIPDKPGETFNCPGGTTTFVTAGRNGWVGDTKYKALSFTVEGTVTALDGSTEDVSEAKVWGRGQSGPGAITCTAPINESGPEGTFVGTVTVVAIPVG